MIASLQRPWKLQGRGIQERWQWGTAESGDRELLTSSRAQSLVLADLVLYDTPRHFDDQVIVCRQSEQPIGDSRRLVDVEVNGTAIGILAGLQREHYPVLGIDNQPSHHSYLYDLINYLYAPTNTDRVRVVTNKADTTVLCDVLDDVVGPPGETWSIPAQELRDRFNQTDLFLNLTTLKDQPPTTTPPPSRTDRTPETDRRNDKPVAASRQQGVLVGYARCSTLDQDLAAQTTALETLGVAPDRIYVDHGLSGTNRGRPGLDQALAAVRAGDTLVVPKLDRLARSVVDARTIADQLIDAGVALSIGGTVYNPGDPFGKMFFNILATFAEFERDLISQRTREGMAIARKAGNLRGRQPKLTTKQTAELQRMHAAGEHTSADLAEIFGVSRATVYRTLNRTKH